MKLGFSCLSYAGAFQLPYPRGGGLGGALWAIGVFSELAPLKRIMMRFMIRIMTRIMMRIMIRIMRRIMIRIIMRIMSRIMMR